MVKCAFIFILLNLFFVENGNACSACAIFKGDHITVGKNLDWFCDDAMLVVNKRNLSKEAFIQTDKEPLKWVSRYGSITFNSTGIGAPGGGMNEAGLVIEESALNATQYPGADGRKAIDEIQWIQYQLDNCKSIDEVMATDKQIRIQSYYWRSHYFIYDKSGEALTVDALDGRLVYNRIPRGGVQVLTNNPYNESLDVLRKHVGFGGAQAIQTSTKSLDRFCKAAEMIKAFEQNDSTDIVDYTFSILKTISQPATTWSVVYDITNLIVYYRTAASPGIKAVPLKNFDFSCDAPTLALDIRHNKAGDVSKDFTVLTAEWNKTLVSRVIEQWRKAKFALHITDSEAARIGAYLNTMSCLK